MASYMILHFKDHKDLKIPNGELQSTYKAPTWEDAQELVIDILTNIASQKGGDAPVTLSIAKYAITSAPVKDLSYKFLGHTLEIRVPLSSGEEEVEEVKEEDPLALLANFQSYSARVASYLRTKSERLHLEKQIKELKRKEEMALNDITERITDNISYRMKNGWDK